MSLFIQFGYFSQSLVQSCESVHFFVSASVPDLRARNKKNNIVQPQTSEKKNHSIKMALYSCLLFLNNFQMKSENREMVFLTANSANTMWESQARVI